MATPKKPTKTAAKKSDTKTETSTSSGGSSSLFNSDQAAHSAAAMLAARGNKTLGTKPESASFKKLKEGLGGNTASASSLLSGVSSLTKGNQHSGFAKQVGHNQTNGASLSRTGVPRRTANG